MTDRLVVDMCVIGAGTGGLTVAAGAAQLGARTVLFERGKMGGDCLNYGCVPSKAPLAAAKAAKAVRAASRFGVTTAPPAIDFPAVNRHVHDTIAAIAPHDSQERFEGLGVKVIRAEARFSGPGEVEGGGFTVQARRIVIATGTSPAVPPIPGLDQVPFFTNETLFDNTVLPEHLIVIGGGPVGLEMAQAHRLLGSRVTVLEAAQILPRDDPELVALLRRQLEADGIFFARQRRLSGSRGPRRDLSPPSNRRVTRSGSKARTCWSPPGGGRISRNSISTEPASSTIQRA